MAELLTAPGPPVSPPHGGAFVGTVAECLALVVAPSTGRFRPDSRVERVLSGHLLGHVTGGRGRADEVRTPVSGRVRALLARPGQLVRAGQGLAWLERDVETPGPDPASAGSAS